MAEENKNLIKLTCTQCKTSEGKTWCTCFTIVDRTKEFIVDKNCMNPEHGNTPMWEDYS